ncbi:MAG TPA: PhnD/SsuA/transferrin family substrate-binding protein [Verrucomicrobiae bacterium]|nr:PhnD/SsuA/transferrin family substrate-binding protein [Verrucomicrobiae bacterium]
MRAAGLSIAVALCVASVATADGPRPFLFLKTGEKFATQETAGPTVAGLTAYVGEKVAGTTNAFEPRVMNEPVKAAEYCGKSKPSLGIVTPGFYLAYAKALGMEPLLETKRAGLKEERFVLVAQKDAGDDLAKFHGKTIATPLADEQWYVIAVVLQGKLGEEIRLKPTMDVEGAVFDLAEGGKNAADAVLLETAAWDLFKDDPDSGGKLKVVYQSDELPRDLLVAFGTNGGTVDTDKVKQVLKALSGSESGQKILRSIQVESFVDIDQNRLSKAEKLFHGK